MRRRAADPVAPPSIAEGALIVLGVDPGLRETGFGLLRQDGDALVSLEYGSIATQPDIALAERLRRLYDELTAVMRRWQPHEVAVEEAFVGANKRVAVAMGEARGAVLLAAAGCGLAVFEYSAAQVKRTVAGYGRGDKAQVQAMVRLQLGLAEDPQPHHAADALAAALCHLAHRRAARLREVVS